MARECAERVGCEVRQGYGLTETSPVTHLVPPGGDGEKLESVGPPIPNTETRIVDVDTGEDVVPRGELGAPEVRSFVAERVAPYKKVRAVEFVEEIPKSASGKILRRVLVEGERAAAGA